MNKSERAVNKSGKTVNKSEKTVNKNEEVVNKSGGTVNKSELQEGLFNILNGICMEYELSKADLARILHRSPVTINSWFKIASGNSR